MGINEEILSSSEKKKSASGGCPFCPVDPLLSGSVGTEYRLLSATRIEELVLKSADQRLFLLNLYIALLACANSYYSMPSSEEFPAGEDGVIGYRSSATGRNISSLSVSKIYYLDGFFFSGGRLYMQMLKNPMQFGYKH